MVCVYANARCHKEQASRRKCVVSVLLRSPYRIRVSGAFATPTKWRLGQSLPKRNVGINPTRECLKRDFEADSDPFKDIFFIEVATVSLSVNDVVAG